MVDCLYCIKTWIKMCWIFFIWCLSRSVVRHHYQNLHSTVMSQTPVTSTRKDWKVDIFVVCDMFVTIIVIRLILQVFFFYLATWWAKNGTNLMFPGIHWKGSHSIHFKPCWCAYWVQKFFHFQSIGQIFGPLLSVRQSNQQSTHLKGWCLLLVSGQ